MSQSIRYRTDFFRNQKMVFLSLLLCIFSEGLNAYGLQDESKAAPDFSFTCVQSGNEYILKTRISQWTGERDMPVQGAMIAFSNPAGEETKALENVQADMNGEAVFRIDKSSDKLISLNGSYSFKAEFPGNEKFEPAEEQVDIKPLNLSLDFREIESVKTIIAEAYELDNEGGKIPLDGWDIYFFVPRSFSLLPFGDGWFEEGRAELNFPTSIPGDSVGNLTIIARIEDHELYGNIEVVETKNWGVARPNIVVEKRRGLGDTDAPLWMVYTLIVLLSVVWFHYLYVFYIMFKINRLRSNQEV